MNHDDDANREYGPKWLYHSRDEALAAYVATYGEEPPDLVTSSLDLRLFAKRGFGLNRNPIVGPIASPDAPATPSPRDPTRHEERERADAENERVDAIRMIDRAAHAARLFEHARDRARERIFVELTREQYDELCTRAAVSNRRGEIRHDSTQKVRIEWNGHELELGWHVDLHLVTTELGWRGRVEPSPAAIAGDGVDEPVTRLPLDDGPLDSEPGLRYGIQTATPETPGAAQGGPTTMQETGLQTSPFKQATQIPKRLKAFIWGASGAGKTTLALNFPAPVVIDLERGTDHYGEKFKFERLDPAPQTVDQMFEAVRWLLANDHEYRTLIIDPVTIFWDMVQDEWIDRLGDRFARKTGQSADEYDMQPKDWKPLKAEFKEFMRLLSALDMNVIVTAREKIKYAGGSGDFMKVAGETFDGEKSLPYLFDVEVRLYRDSNGARIAHVLKDRTNRLPGRDFPAVYAQFEECLGKDSLAAKATARPDEAKAAAPAEPRPAAAPAQRPASPPPGNGHAPGNGGNGGGGEDVPATDKQLSFLRRLIENTGAKYEEYLFDKGCADNEGNLIPLSKKHASFLIDALTKKPADAAGQS